MEVPLVDSSDISNRGLGIGKSTGSVSPCFGFLLKWTEQPWAEPQLLRHLSWGRGVQAKSPFCFGAKLATDHPLAAPAGGLPPEDR